MKAQNGDFKAQLGDGRRCGFLPLEQRLDSLQEGVNPYVPGTSLPGNSPLFFGRDMVLGQLLALYRRPGKPACVSLLGERRIGKSSLLNQLCQSLGAVPQLVTLYASAQNWNTGSRQNFYRQLHGALRSALPELPEAPVEDYAALRDLIASLVPKYRFLLIIDEFEEMAGNPHFDGVFFSNLRALGDGADYHFGFLLASRRPLKELCHRYEIAASKFWNIFGTRKVLGLLEEGEAEGLVRLPVARTLPDLVGAEAEKLWRERIRPLTGCHPAFIQMAALEFWDGLAGGFESDAAQLELGLREHLLDLWYKRSPGECELLIKAAAGVALPAGHELTVLVVRGLLTGDGQPFSELFRQVIKESLPEGQGLDEAVEAVEALDKGLDKAGKFMAHLERFASLAGKVYKAFRGASEEGG